MEFTLLDTQHVLLYSSRVSSITGLVYKFVMPIIVDLKSLFEMSNFKLSLFIN